MNEKVLTDDEVDALLVGVESGEVEVQSAEGSHYAAVSNYEIPRRSHIASKSFPRLELLNEKFAERLKKRTQQILHCELGLISSETIGSLFGDVCGQHDGMLVATVFSAPPLPGHGAIVFEAELVHQLVELFFGGAGSAPKEPGLGGFTLGELRVTRAFSDIVLKTLQEMWEPIQAIDPQQHKTESSLNLTDIAEETDAVVMSTFDFSLDEHAAALHVILPEAMLDTFLPLFKGMDRKDDPVQDQKWAATIRSSLTGTVVSLSSNVGHATMTLGELICLEPGDIIDIDGPQRATIFAQNVPVLDGRFGVHNGHNAIEAAQWLGADQTIQ